MTEKVFIVATLKSWNIEIFNNRIKKIPGQWHLIANPAHLTLEKVMELKPDMIFFPHWSAKVPDEILQAAECVCFHMTDLPFGRGGSPLQNLIEAGLEFTQISALKMTKELDAGPVYMKLPLPLTGLAEEIFIRAGEKIARMIEIIVNDRPIPQPQKGDVVIFKRRRPEQSLLNTDSDNLQKVFDQIRMLDAEGYPKAFIKVGNYLMTFQRPALRADGIHADVKISLSERKPND